MRRALPLIIPVLALSVLSSTGTSFAKSHGTMSTCAMFTASDATKILGGSVKKALSPKEGVFTTCSYARQTPYRLIEALSATSATLSQQHAPATTAAAEYSGALRGAPGKTVTVKGLGDKAFYVPGLHEIWVLKSDVIFNLTGQQLSQATLTSAAKLVLKHL